MRTRLVVGLGLGALGMVAVACSSSSSGGGAPPNPYPDPETFCKDVAAAECQTASKGGDALDSCTLTMDATTCESFRQAECAKGNIIIPFAGSDSAMSRTYTSGNVQACLDALTSAFGPGGTSMVGGTNVTGVGYANLFGDTGLIAVCEKVFLGSKGDMQSCTSDYDCTQSGEKCEQDPLNPTSSVCATPRPVALGDACRDPGDVCTNGYCSTAGTPKCVALVANGQACTVDGQCQTGSHCAGSVCMALGASGAGCASNADCDSSQMFFCDTYRSGGAVCTTGLLFGGGPDCTGFLLGQGLGGTVDAGGGNDSGSGGDTGTGTGDAATGG